MQGAKDLNASINLAQKQVLQTYDAKWVTDLEFVQFHPTALNQEGAPRFLISEALRGEGAKLVNASGEAFMTRYNAAGELAPRDVVARSIAREMERTKGLVYLTLAHLDPEHVRTRFPTIAETCKQVSQGFGRLGLCHG